MIYGKIALAVTYVPRTHCHKIRTCPLLKADVLRAAVFTDKHLLNSFTKHYNVDLNLPLF